MRRLRCEPLTPAAFAPFGEVLVPQGRGAGANEGRARRHELAGIARVAPSPAPSLQTALYEIRGSTLPFEATALECHPHSAQLFFPGAGSAYLACVCLPDRAGAPDLATARAFRGAAPDGLVYAPGVWHLPLVALDGAGTFLMQMWGGAGADDCIVRRLDETLVVSA